MLYLEYQAKQLLLQQKEKEEEDTIEEEIKIDTTSEDFAPKPLKHKPAKDTGRRSVAYSNAAILTDERKNMPHKKTNKG